MAHHNPAPYLGMALAAILARAGGAQADAPVVINELSYADTGADTLEFVELYNATSFPIDIGQAASFPLGYGTSAVGSVRVGI